MKTKYQPKYDFRTIEGKWQKIWEKEQIYKTPDFPEKDKYYMLVMYAYPSGDIHMGHFRNYILGDATARYQKMKGKDVLHPFGWDAFGLPAERAAISHKMHPAEWTYKNIEVSRDTLKKTGVSYDWSREVATCDPEYYKWTQWMFVQLFKKGLAYQKTGWVNWCPEDKTVLANEQVVNGRCERCETPVEKKELKQWYFKITEYADRLIDGLDLLPGWPENVKTMQKEWIGRSHGLEVDFIIKESGEKLPIFTTRPDTIYGVTFMAIAPESPLIESLNLEGEYKTKIEAYRKEVLLRSEIDRASVVGEKDGVFTGKYAINPFNGEEIQLWVADYVLAGYGTGAVMAVPAHDSRDFLFAKKYDIPIKVVIHPDKQTTLDVETMEDAYVEYGIMVNSDQFDGCEGIDGIKKVSEYAEKQGIGRQKVNYKLRDWSISRQRYWGAPIPIIHCPKCGPRAVPEKDLPVLLPKVKDYIPKGRSPLADVPEYINAKCPSCGGEAKRDPDTMDTFVCSSWYYLRYIDPNNNQVLADGKKLDSWLPIDKYIGGITHATGHLIYFRFFHKFLKDLGIVKDEEPATILFNHGLVMDANGEVMSKSKGNVVSPTGLMKERGVDITRLGMFFTAPAEREVLWSNEVMVGIEKFVKNRLYPMTSFYRNSDADLKSYFNFKKLPEYERDIYIRLNQTIKRVGDDIERLQINTAIAALMEFCRDFASDKISDSTLNDYAILKTIQLISPLAPHLAEEMWQMCGQEFSIFQTEWPEYDKKAMKFDSVTIAVQINGKRRSEISIARDSSEADVLMAALEDSRIVPYTKGSDIIKKIYIPNRLINIVVK